MIQGGDLSVKQDGSGNASVFGSEFFKDENFDLRHTQAGAISMANAGPNSNGSQFFITLKSCPHLDGKHVVFGQVIEGLSIIQEIAKVPTNEKDTPRIPV